MPVSGVRHLLLHGNEAGQRAAGNRSAEAAGELRESGLEQQLARERRGPRELRDLLAIVPDVAGLRRECAEEPCPDATERDPVVPAVAALLGALRVGGAVADLLIIQIETDLVARRHLPGQADGLDQLGGRGAGRQILVALVVPRRLVAGVAVAEEAGDLLLVAVAADVVEEPQAVPDDRTTQREVRVPVLDQGRHVGQPVATQLVVQVVALRPLAGGAEEGGAAERVAAGLRNEVEGRPAAIGLTETAGDRHLNLGRFADRITEAGDAAAIERRPDVHAVDLNRAFIAASTARGEEVGGHAGADVETGRLNARYRRQQVAIAARRRNRLNDLVRQHHLPTGAGLRIDDRRLTGHGDRFLNPADAHLGVDGEHARSAELNAVAFDGREAGQRVCQRIGPGRQVLDSILPGAVARRGADLFDQHGAGGLDGHTREHRT